MIKTYLTLTTQLGKPIEVDGSEFMVFPVTMLVEGVHHAANGPPAYYPADVLASNVDAWEGASVTVNHPQAPDGTYISAKSPGVNACGVVKDPSRKGKKLKAKVYIRPNEVEPEHLEAMQAENMEVSTGIFAEVREEKGEWNGEPYEVVIEKIYPDHLALLPNDRGACSQNDGCGIRANSEGVTAMAVKHNSTVADEEPAWSSVDKTELPKLAFADMEGEKYPHHWVSGDTMYLHRGGLNAAWAAANGARSGQEASAEVKAHLQAHRDALGLKANETGTTELHEAARAALGSGNNPDEYYWIADVFPSRVIYEIGSGMFSRDYVWDEEGKMKFTSEPVKVRRKVDYVAAQACCPDKVAMVIQANKGFDGDDAEWLTGLSSSQLDKLIPKEEKMQTLQEFIEGAPDHLRGPLANAVATSEAVRQELIDQILTNGESGLTAEQLKGIDISALKGIAKLAVVVKPADPNYSLANGAALPVTNQTNTEEPLVMTGLFQGGAN